MNLIHLISRAALHIFGYRRLLIWHLFACFIASCSSMQVRNGVNENGISNNGPTITHPNTGATDVNDKVKDVLNVIAETSSSQKKIFLLANLTKQIKQDPKLANIVGNNDQTALHETLSIKDTPLPIAIDLLLLTDWTIQDRKGNTVLHLLMSELSMVKKLVEIVQQLKKEETKKKTESALSLRDIEDVLFNSKNKENQTPLDLLNKEELMAALVGDLSKSSQYRKYRLSLQKALRYNMMDVLVNCKLIKIIKNKVEIQNCKHQFDLDNFNTQVFEYQTSSKKQQFSCPLCNNVLHTKN